MMWSVALKQRIWRDWRPTVAPKNHTIAGERWLAGPGRRSNLPAGVPVERCATARGLAPSSLGLDLSVAFPLSKFHQEDAPAGAALVEGDTRLFFFFLAQEQAVIGGAHVLPGGGDFAPRRQRFGHHTPASSRGDDRPGGAVLGLRCGLQPTPELAGSGPVPAFGARGGFSSRAGADAKDRDVDGEEDIVVADLHGEGCHSAPPDRCPKPEAWPQAVSFSANQFTSRRMADRIDRSARDSVNRPEK